MDFCAKGIIPPLVTPFSRDDSLNEQVLREVIRYVLKNGVSGVFIAGSQGEFYGLKPEERLRAFEVAVEEVNGQVPVYAGTSCISTAETIYLTKAAEKIGVDAVSVITPYFISVNEEELYQHYKAVAAATNLPILLYNNPNRTGVKISVNNVKRLSKIDNIVGIKDSSGDMNSICEYIRNTDRNFGVLSGFDTLIFSTLAVGGAGAVAASANVAPALVVEIYNRFKMGDLEAAREAQFKLAPLRMAFSLGSFPVVIKEAMEIIGFPVGPARAPIQSLAPDKRDILKGILKDLGLPI